MTINHVVIGDTYDRWLIGDRFSIARYSNWGSNKGTFFVAYNLNNLSRRINQAPVGSFNEAMALCATTE